MHTSCDWQTALKTCGFLYILDHIKTRFA